jgi:hypothetical protein
MKTSPSGKFLLLPFRGWGRSFALHFKWWGLALFLALHTLASYYYISRQNITFDEPGYIEYAKRWLHGKPERIVRIDDSKSPVIAVCWLPRIVRQIINPGYQLNDYGRKDQAEGRYMMIVFSLLAAVYTYWWCRELYGANGWLFPLLLLLFDPLYLAYSALITTDLACGTFLVALLYHYRKSLIYNCKKQLCFTAVFTGIAILTKQTLLFVIVLLPLLFLIHQLLAKETSVLVSRKSLSKGVLFACIVVVIINAGFYFKNTLTPFGDYSFQSRAFQKLQTEFDFLHRLPVPVPESYVHSLDLIKANAENGAGKAESTYNGVYLFGNRKLDGVYWYYYIVLLFYKMPVGSLLQFLACLPVFINRFSKQKFAKQYMFLVVPVLFFLLLLSFLNKFQIGVRHILLVFPLMYIGLGRLFYEVAGAKLKYRILAGGLVVSTFISVAFYYPYIIPYTNELVGDKKTVYKKILDSSIDYGQSDSSVTKYVSRHPEVQIPSSTPGTGKYIVTMRNLVEQSLNNKEGYNWLQKFEPAEVYKHTILLYDITAEDLEKAGIWANTK